MIFQTPALSRSRIDRAAHRRAQDGLLADLLTDPAARVLVLDGGQAPVTDTGDGVRLAFVEGGRDVLAARVLADGALGDAVLGDGALADGVAARPAVGDGAPRGAGGTVLAFLGEEAGPPGSPGTSFLLVAAPAGTWAVEDLVPGARGAGLREVGHLLDAAGAGLLTTAVALAAWHGGHGWCARCGTRSVPVCAGWARRCPRCEREQYPRLDPAVIMAVTDAEDRLLLGRQVSWPARRVSVLAGFVEPGESLEAAVCREVLEEVGVLVEEVTYLGNQPWPFPSSLMLGFSARATGTDLVLDGTEIAEASWWSRGELRQAVATGRVLVPSPVSIARWLVERWYGGRLTDTGEPWR